MHSTPELIELNRKFFDERPWDKLFFMSPDAEDFQGVVFQPDQKGVSMIFDTAGVDDDTSIKFPHSAAMRVPHNKEFRLRSVTFQKICTEFWGVFPALQNCFEPQQRSELVHRQKNVGLRRVLTKSFEVLPLNFKCGSASALSGNIERIA